MSSKPIRIPGADHPISISLTRGRLTIVASGKRIADTREALTDWADVCSRVGRLLRPPDSDGRSRPFGRTRQASAGRHQWGCATELSSPSRERKVFKIGEELLFLYPTARSIVGTSPFNGRLTTDHGNKFFA
jgi:hypothetical protein